MCKNLGQISAFCYTIYFAWLHRKFSQLDHSILNTWLRWTNYDQWPKDTIISMVNNRLWKLWIEYVCRPLIICIAIMRLTHFRYWFCSQLPRRNFSQFQVSTSRTSTVEWYSKMASKEFNQSLSGIYAIFLFSFCLPLILQSKYQWLENSTNQVPRFSSLDQSKPIRKREIVPSARSKCTAKFLGFWFVSFTHVTTMAIDI